LSDDARAIAVVRPANVAYLTGFEGVFDGEEAHVALVTNATALVFTDSRYATALKTAARGTPWEVVVVKDELRQAVCSRAQHLGAEWLGVRSDA